jgi:hypothetical protein
MNWLVKIWSSENHSMHFSRVHTSYFWRAILFVCFFICLCDVQTRLQMGKFIVNKDSVYKTLEELWDGEI